MTSPLVTTLRGLLEQADELFWAGRLSTARKLYERLLEEAQERTDRGMEVIARAMLARYHVKRREHDLAREELGFAARLLEVQHLEAHGRYLAVCARLAADESDADEARRVMSDYLRWAEDRGRGTEMVDAALLLAHFSPADEREEWLRRAIDHALAHEVHEPLSGAYTSLGMHFDGEEAVEEALAAYEQALRWERRAGNERFVTGACWAVGAAAIRAGDWPHAQEHLEEAVRLGSSREDCGDYVALAQADLARVHREYGDIVEARRCALAALALAREQGFAGFWPHRWEAILELGRALGV